MTPERRIDIGQRFQVDTAKALDRFDRAIALMAEAQRATEEALKRKGWTEPKKTTSWQSADAAIKRAKSI
jgi:hypothetical protein